MTLRDLQLAVKKMDGEKGWLDKPYQNVLHLAEELGELSRLILVEEGYKGGESGGKRIGEELSDILYLTLKMSNHYNLDMDEEWAKTFGRYEDK